MGLFLKNFSTNAEYETYINGSGVILPNVSLTVDNNTVHYNPSSPTPTETKIVAKYYVENEGSQIRLFHIVSGSGSGNGSGGEIPFSSMEIDSIEQSEVVNEYTFNTTGEHTVKYTLIDPTSICDSVFLNCYNLTSIVIPDSVTSIGSYALYSCQSLTSIAIPSGVTSIGDDAFRDCFSLTSIDIPSGVTSIGDGVFMDCNSITSITIPNSVTSIGASAFYNCSNLTSINIPSGVTSIGNAAFYYCSSLTSIDIPSGVTSIDDYTFNGCSSLTSIVCNATTAPTISNATFSGVKTGGTLTVPSGSTGYDTWMGTSSYYLGYYNWTKVEQ